MNGVEWYTVTPQNAAHLNFKYLSHKLLILNSISLQWNTKKYSALEHEI